MLLELLFILAAFALAIVVLVLGGITLAAILHGDRPELLLSDPAARRSVLGG
jgi:hypothetical protein